MKDGTKSARTRAGARGRGARGAAVGHRRRPHVSRPVHLLCASRAIQNASRPANSRARPPPFLTRALAAFFAPAAGDWAIVDGVKMRQGRGVYDDGAKQRYEGEWLNDMMHGRGTFEYASGAKYEGEFVANKYDGYGTFVFANGAEEVYRHVV